MTFNEKFSAVSFHDSREEKKFRAKMINKGIHKNSKVSADFKPIGFWREANGFGWSIFEAAEHLNLRTKERAIPKEDVELALVLMLEAIEQAGELRYVIGAAAMGKRIVINDEVNGISYVLAIYPEKAEMAILTTWKVTNSVRKNNMVTITLFRNGQKIVFTEKNEWNQETHYSRHMLDEPILPINE